MYHLKICGVLLKSDIDSAADSGADCIGLNFFDASVRYVEPDSLEALALARHARKRSLKTVGVFVNQPAEEIAAIASGLSLDAVQLHGDESMDDARQLQEDGVEVIKALRLAPGPMSVAEIDAQARPWLDAGFPVLLDAESGEVFGGTGKKLDWPSIAAWAQANPNATWILAGGLKPENVAEAIRVCGAKSVDVASGVEEPRGTKHPAKIAAFCQAVAGAAVR